MQPSNITQYLRRNRILIVAVTVLLIIVWIASRYGRLEVSSSVPGVGITLINSNGSVTTLTESAGGPVSKFVRKGTYEVQAVGQGKASFQLVTTKGFFGKTIATIDVEDERNRSFVGMAPAGCMYVVETILYSHGCDGTVGTVRHVPASDTSPTYTLKVAGVAQSIEGVVYTNEGTVVLGHQPRTATSQPSAHALHVVDANSKPKTTYTAIGADESSSYKVTNFRDGFLVYERTLSEIFYYPTVSSRPETITIEQPKDNKVIGYLLATQDDVLVATYSNKALDEVKTEERIPGKIITEVVWKKGNDTRRYNFDAKFDSVRPCGTERICALEQSKSQLSVFQAGKEAKLLQVITGIQSLESTDSRILLVRGDGIWSFDADTLAAKRQYSFGSHYSFCGLEAVGEDYLLCVSSKKGKNYVMRINPAVADADAIDKKIAEFTGVKNLNDPSIYGNRIYLSPSISDLVYDPVRRTTDFDPAQLEEVKRAARAKIAELQIDTTRYKISGLDL